jgi:hypothetical protein
MDHRVGQDEAWESGVYTVQNTKCCQWLNGACVQQSCRDIPVQGGARAATKVVLVLSLRPTDRTLSLLCALAISRFQPVRFSYKDHFRAIYQI